MNYCFYYQARILREKTWLFVALLRSVEHIAFDRTLDVKDNVFEFYVPADRQVPFLAFMEYMIQQGVALDLQELPNRLKDPLAIL